MKTFFKFFKIFLQVEKNPQYKQLWGIILENNIQSHFSSSCNSRQRRTINGQNLCSFACSEEIEKLIYLRDSEIRHNATALPESHRKLLQRKGGGEIHASNLLRTLAKNWGRASFWKELISAALYYWKFLQLPEKNVYVFSDRYEGDSHSSWDIRKVLITRIYYQFSQCIL